MDPIKPSPLPASHPGRWIEPVKVIPGPPQKFIICSEFYVGYDTHWMMDKKVVCTQNPTTCQGCIAKLDKRWDGGMIVTFPDYRHPYILPLTLGGVRHCKALQERNGNLRGLPILASRLRKTKWSGLKLELFYPEPLNERLLPLPNDDIVEALSRLWKIQLAAPVQGGVSDTLAENGSSATQPDTCQPVQEGTQAGLFTNGQSINEKGEALSPDEVRAMLRKAGLLRE